MRRIAYLIIVLTVFESTMINALKNAFASKKVMRSFGEMSTDKIARCIKFIVTKCQQLIQDTALITYNLETRGRI
jgi:hypothetical protein